MEAEGISEGSRLSISGEAAVAVAAVVVAAVAGEERMNKLSEEGRSVRGAG